LRQSPRKSRAEVHALTRDGTLANQGCIFGQSFRRTIQFFVQLIYQRQKLLRILFPAYSQAEFFDVFGKRHFHQPSRRNLAEGASREPYFLEL